jgi:hypothetical protein
MRDKYPQDMTIVLQHQFWDLGITEHAFEVGLSFSGVPERLLIPFDALTGFFDPSVHFGLKFEVTDGADASDEATAMSSVPASPPAALPGRPLPEPAKAQDAGEAPAEPAAGSAEVVSLDAFRKKT